MKEADIIARTHKAFGRPISRDHLCRDLDALGLRAGDVLLVHSSLSAVGWVSGGAETLVGALRDVLGSRGTLVMPTHSGHLSDPAAWEHPPVPEPWIEVIRDTMPAFDPRITGTRGIGAVPEFFRRLPGVRRSKHPMDSFAAAGPKARCILRNHALAEGLGEHSPLARIYDLDGRVLLLGCGHGNNTSLHLAEHRADWPGKTNIPQGSPLRYRRRRVWRRYEELDYDDGDFPVCGAEFDRTAGPAGHLNTGAVGLAESRLMSQRALVDFAAAWFSANRGTGGAA